jgi:hypothetical protein
VAIRRVYFGKGANELLVGPEGLKLMYLVFCGGNGQAALVN